MTQSEFEILCRPEVRQTIEDNIERNPLDIALDKHIEHPAIVATQVKRLQRARTKLPELYAVRAILPPRAYEQSSSELCAARKSLEGESVLDLTCGLGIDTIALSRRFKRVVSCEKDALLSEITRYNLQLLGIDNVRIENCAAEEYLAQSAEHFDWIFVDPDRRGDRGEKLVRLEDCSPDMVALYPATRRVADKVCIKCSPLFDMAEATRLFEGCSVECISMGGECKEVNIYIDGTPATMAAEAVGVARFEVEKDKAQCPFAPAVDDVAAYRYLSIPDVSLVHSRLAAAAFEGVADMWSHNGVALSVDMPKGVLGRVFSIAESYLVGSKELKKRLKGRRVEIFSRDFSSSNAEICRKYSVKEGADEVWCFTRICNKGYAFLIEKC